MLKMPDGFGFNPNAIDSDNLILKSELIVNTLKDVLKEKNKSHEWAAIVPKKLKPNKDVFKAIQQKHEKEKRRKKAKINKKNNKGETPILLAVFNKNDSLARKLERVGANKNLEDNYGNYVITDNLSNENSMDSSRNMVSSRNMNSSRNMETVNEFPFAIF